MMAADEASNNPHTNISIKPLTFSLLYLALSALTYWSWLELVHSAGVCWTLPLCSASDMMTERPRIL